EGLHVGGAQRVARGLERHRIGTGEKAVVETLESHALTTELLLHPVMPVETEFHGGRQICTDLHERRSPVAVLHIEIELLDRDPLARALEADLRAGAGR